MMTDGRSSVLPELDPVIHPQIRLQVMTSLCALSHGERLAFTELQQLVGTSPGNLGAHLAKLEEAGYVLTTKAFRGRRPVTWLEATDKGRRAFEKYVRSLRTYFRRLDSFEGARR